MMKLIQKIRECATGKRTLFFFFITQVVYVVMLTVTIPHVLAYSNGMKLLDLMPTGYSSVYVQQLLETLGDVGRHAYLWQQLPLDMIYPGLFVVSYALLIAYFLKMISREEKWGYLPLLPLFAGSFDYLENFGTITMLNLYPTFYPSLVALTSTFTVVKSVLSVAVFVTVIVLFIWAMWKKLSTQQG